MRRLKEQIASCNEVTKCQQENLPKVGINCEIPHYTILINKTPKVWKNVLYWTNQIFESNIVAQRIYIGLNSKIDSDSFSIPWNKKLCSW